MTDIHYESERGRFYHAGYSPASDTHIFRVLEFQEAPPHKSASFELTGGQIRDLVNGVWSEYRVGQGSGFHPEEKNQLAEGLGLQVDPKARVEFWNTVAKFATEGDATDPNYYTFGDVEVRQISGHLTGFGAQGLQYIARATRLDGQNKGDAVEDLRKALRFIEWEIERLEAQQ